MIYDAILLGRNEQNADLCKEHQWMPALHFDCDHQILCEDQSGERDPDHVHESLLKKKHATYHDCTALVKRLSMVGVRHRVKREPPLEALDGHRSRH